MRPTNPEFAEAWRALWGVHDGDLTVAIEAKQRIQADKGTEYGGWVLDQINIETMLAVDYSLQDSLPAPRFRWLSFADWLMWPVPAIGSPDKGLTDGYAAQIEAACRRAGIDHPPATLDDYVATILEPELEQRRADGAVGLKFQTPYYRPIDFGQVPLSRARELYERADLSVADHRELEDFLFAAIARKAGALGLPVQMHTGLGPKPHFESQGSSPLLMEPAVIAAPGTRFLMLHAGWPFDRQAVAALAHENVYVDISCATVHLYPRNLARVVREALEFFPEKVLYGTDAYSDVALALIAGDEPRSNFLQGWEEKAWLLDRTARDALSLALTDMRSDGVITHDDVERLSTMVLRANALNLYPL